MELFFFLAGFFAALVIDKRGVSAFIRDRIRRILLVFVLWLYPMKLLLARRVVGDRWPQHRLAQAASASRVTFVVATGPRWTQPGLLAASPAHASVVPLLLSGVPERPVPRRTLVGRAAARTRHRSPSPTRWFPRCHVEPARTAGSGDSRHTLARHDEGTGRRYSRPDPVLEFSRAGPFDQFSFAFDSCGCAMVL